MPRWVTTTKPAAELTREGEPYPVGPHGDMIQIYKTAFGKRFAQVTEPTAFTFWLREVDT